MRKVIAVLMIFFCPVIQAQKVPQPCVEAGGNGALGVPSYLNRIPPRPNFQPGFQAPGGTPGSRAGFLNVFNFGAKGDSRSATDAQIYVGQNLVTSNSLNFTAADVGKTIWAVNQGNPFTYSATLGGPPLGNSATIASVISSTQATIAGYWIAFASYTGTPSYAVIGHDDTSAIAAAVNASLAQRSGRSCVFIPPGSYIVRGNLANTTASQSLCLYGSSVVTTFLFVAPDLPYNNPAGFGALLNINGGASMGEFDVEAGSAFVNASNQYLINLSGPNALMSDVVVRNWFAQGPGNAAINVAGDYARMYALASPNNGATSLSVRANFVQCISCELSSYGEAVNIMSGQNIMFLGGEFVGLGNTGLGVHISGAAGSVQNSSMTGAKIDIGDPQVAQGGPVQALVESQSGQGTQFSFIGDGFVGVQSNVTAIVINNCAKCTVSALVRSSQLNSSGNGVAVNNSATFIDGGGNTVVGALTGPGTFLKQCP